jgi:V8-like Glu-specific endopeptidase
VTSQRLRARLLVAAIAGASLLTGAAGWAITGGGPAASGAYGFTAKLDIGGIRGCSATLVDPQWLLTASSCFPENSGQDGAPAKATTATVGRAVLSGTDGQVVPVSKLVFRADRNLVLARLATPVTGVTPIKLATAAPAGNDTLRIAGYGRTATEWVPDLHSATTTVDGVTETTVSITANGVTTCKGDSGGPAFRESGELVAIHSTSWQNGCLGSTETRQGTTETRVDNLGGWLESQMLAPSASPAPQHAINLTWQKIAAQGNATYKVYGSTSPDASTLLGTSPTPNFTHAGVAARQQWYYKVVPVVGGQDGPASAVFSATSALPLLTDSNGDKKDEINAFYDYGNATTRLFTWDTTATGFSGASSKWASGAGQWAVDRSKFLDGDFNGDGRADVAAIYYYGNSVTRIFMWEATGTGFTDATAKWESNGWDASKAKFVSGDFNGDGRTDIGAFADYGNGVARMFIWEYNGTAFGNPTVKWESQPGGWNVGQSKFVTGDFNGDGRTDIGALYDYGNNSVRLFTWESTGTGFGNATSKWASGTGQWEGARTRVFTGDFNGDGRTDVGGVYDYGNNTIRIYVWTATPAGFTDATSKYLTNGWNAAQSKFVTGDFNGDGRSDIGGIYDYGNGVTTLFTWDGTPTGLADPVGKWTSNPGGWAVGPTTLVNQY